MPYEFPGMSQGIVLGFLPEIPAETFPQILALFGSSIPGKNSLDISVEIYTEAPPTIPLCTFSEILTRFPPRIPLGFSTRFIPGIQ